TTWASSFSVIVIVLLPPSTPFTLPCTLLPRTWTPRADLRSTDSCTETGVPSARSASLPSCGGCSLLSPSLSRIFASFASFRFFSTTPPSSLATTVIVLLVPSTALTWPCIPGPRAVTATTCFLSTDSCTVTAVPGVRSASFPSGGGG